MSQISSGGNGAGGAAAAAELASLIESNLDRRKFQDHHWSGTFWEYLAIADADPSVLRNAYQRLYDAIMSHGHEKYRLFSATACGTTSSPTRSTLAPTPSSGWTSR